MAADAQMLEINPLAVRCDGTLALVGAMLAIDEAALPRHPAWRMQAQPGRKKRDTSQSPRTRSDARPMNARQAPCFATPNSTATSGWWWAVVAPVCCSMT